MYKIGEGHYINPLHIVEMQYVEKKVAEIGHEYELSIIMSNHIPQLDSKGITQTIGHIVTGTKENMEQITQQLIFLSYPVEAVEEATSEDKKESKIIH